ncbi:MAG: thrombospondin type 3 repeat-containing protein [Candidatus Doudnabacteria bacterium]|nr:thrombospondin type 3 repeat-containing protein [Candidatus Doudnabacteria bacterium]
MQKYFAKDVCDDDATCGDNADVDNDGISNYQEFVAGTNPTDQDTDLDGLADGDEVNIYGTNPINKFTDNRSFAKEKDFNDGISIKNGYDPLTPGDKFTETRLATIQAKIVQYQLHVPTTTTLGLNTNGTPVQPAGASSSATSPLAITTQLLEFEVGLSYSMDFEASGGGGLMSYKWEVVNKKLPPGITVQVDPNFCPANKSEPCRGLATFFGQIDSNKYIGLDYSVTMKVTSGTQSVSKVIPIKVIARKTQ